MYADQIPMSRVALFTHPIGTTSQGRKEGRKYIFPTPSKCFDDGDVKEPHQYQVNTTSAPLKAILESLKLKHFLW